MRKYLKISAAIVVIGLGVVAYFWFMPHRDVQKTKAFAEIEAQTLVNEFLTDRAKANDRYLANDGDSKVLIISGEVVDRTVDQSGMQVVLVKTSPTDEMGVSCTFSLESNAQAKTLTPGTAIKIKGVIRSGAEIDKDLDLVEHVVLEKCAVVK